MCRLIPIPVIRTVSQDADQTGSRRPPKPVAGDTLVRCFLELKRIALISAIAERLRDQGVPMPGWMRDYTVQPCEFGTTTPAITVVHAFSERSRASIYGGVTLSPPDNIVFDKRDDSVSNALVPIVAKAIKSSRAFTPLEFEGSGRTFTLTTLPGNLTRDAGAVQLVDIDMTVPVMNGSEISLVRRFNSFFASSDIFGKSWTADFPVLAKQLRPVQRIGDKTRSTVVYLLFSPLNTCNALFREKRHMDELYGDLIASDNRDAFLGLGLSKDRRIGAGMSVVYCRDGSRWHFDEEHGLFAATERVPFMTVYRRDGRSGIVRRIEGWYGNSLYADINLQYDENGRLVHAVGSNGKSVTYSYDADGRLQSVRSINELSYAYTNNGLVAAVSRNGSRILDFEYDLQGRMLKQIDASGESIVFQRGLRPDGSMTESAITPADSIWYNASFRPVRRASKDGTITTWSYGGKKALETKVETTGGEVYREAVSADGKTTCLRLPDGRTYTTVCDEAGRTILFKKGNDEVVRLEYTPDGLVSSSRNSGSRITPGYSKDGVMRQIAICSEDEKVGSTQWFKQDLAENGLPVRLTDYSGTDMRMGYDAKGRVTAIVSPTGSLQIARDSSGNVVELTTNWGHEERNRYDSLGRLAAKTIRNGMDILSISCNAGRPSEIRQFDGGVYSISYCRREALGGLPEKITTPDGIVLTYDYNEAGRPLSVNCEGKWRIEYLFDSKGRLKGIQQLKL